MLSDPVRYHCRFHVIGGVAAVFHSEAVLARVGQGVSRQIARPRRHKDGQGSGDGSFEDFEDRARRRGS